MGTDQGTDDKRQKESEGEGRVREEPEEKEVRERSAKSWLPKPSRQSEGGLSRGEASKLKGLMHDNERIYDAAEAHWALQRISGEDLCPYSIQNEKYSNFKWDLRRWHLGFEGMPELQPSFNLVWKGCIKVKQVN